MGGLRAGQQFWLWLRPYSASLQSLWAEKLCLAEQKLEPPPAILFLSFFGSTSLPALPTLSPVLGCSCGSVGPRIFPQPSLPRRSLCSSHLLSTFFLAARSKRELSVR